MDNTSALPGRGAPESGQLDNGRIYLNTAAVVDRIIRDFTAEALQLVGHADFMAQLDFRCRAMNGLFLGASSTDKYERGPWNAPEQLGEYVLKALRINGETRLAVRDAFMVYFNAVLDHAQTGADISGIEPYIGNLRDALLGVSESSPYWSVQA